MGNVLSGSEAFITPFIIVVFLTVTFSYYFLKFLMDWIELICICWCVVIGCYDARIRVLAKYLNLHFGISFDKFEEIEDGIVNSFTDESHEPTE